MNVRQVLVLIAGVVVAFILLWQPPLTVAAGSQMAAVVDVGKLQQYLAIDALVSIVLLVLLFRQTESPAKGSLPPDEAEEGMMPPSPGQLPGGFVIPLTLGERTGAQRFRALVIPIVVVLALVALGILMYVDSLQVSPERPSAFSNPTSH